MATNLAYFRERISHPIRSRQNNVREFRWTLPAAGIAGVVLLVCAGITGAAEPAPASGPAVQASPADGAAKLAWAKFPSEFADYYCTQGVPAKVLKRKPDFCLSNEPLVLDAKHTPFATTMVLDESNGTGTGYDTLYVDLQCDGKYIDNPVYRAEPFPSELGPDRMPVLAYFADVVLPRKSQSTTVRVQLFLEKTRGGDLNCALIPQRWAVGTLTLGGRTMPAALVDTNWDGEVTGLGGHQPGQPIDTGPRGSDCLILGTDGEQELQPSRGSRGLFIPGEGGSSRGFLAKHLVLDSGTYQLRVTQSANGARLALAPAQVPLATVRLTDKPRTSHMLMMGQSTCVMWSGQTAEIAVPADTYLVMNRVHSQAAFTIKAGERKEVDPLTSRERVTALRQAILATRPAAAAGPDAAGQARSSPDADAWTRYVQQFVVTYKLQGAQREQAESILKDLKGRRDEYRTAHKIDYEAIGKIADLAKRSADQAALEKPVDVMFEELKTRLMTLPTETQRKAAEVDKPLQPVAATQPTKP
jgi:hypothetical protein